MVSWRLFRAFILRRLAQDALRSTLTVAGVALGVAVVIAIRLTNASSIQGFETALDTVAGRTAVEISGPGGIDESRLPELLWVREYGELSPVLEGTMAAVVGPRRSEAMKVLGVDILRDRPLRDYKLSTAERLEELDEVTAERFLSLLTAERAVIIPEKFAVRHGLRVEDTLRLMVGDRRIDYTIAGLLADEGPARVLDSNFVLMDIAAAQVAFDRVGSVDRVDVRLFDGLDVGETLDAIAARLPDGLSANRPRRRSEQVERLLGAFHLNLAALSWVALIVGLFLVYNTVTISVLARRDEIGTLRALGLTRRGVQLLFLGEAAALGAVGTVLGLGLGRLMADAAVAITARSVRTLYIATAAAPPEMTAEMVWLGIAVGIPLALAAAIVPAREAAGVPPTAAIRGHDQLATRFRLSPRYLLAPVAVLALAAVLATLGPVDGKPLFGYAASIATILGAALLVPAVLYGASRVSANVLRRTLGVEGLLAHANLGSSIPRLAVSVGALAVSLSMMVAVAVMIGSFRDTVAYWVGQTIRGDLAIGPGYAPRQGDDQTLSKELIELVRRQPGIAAVDTFRNIDFTYQDNLVVLVTGNLEVSARLGGVLFKDPVDGLEAMRSAIGQDAVLVSESFATRYGKGPGDTLELDTPKGRRPFRVVAVYYDYSSDRGVIVMDRSTFTPYFGDLPPSGMVAWVEPGRDPEEVRRALLKSVGEGYSIFAYTNRALRDEVLRIFDSTFAITYALEGIAIVVAMLGVAGTLLTLVLERRRELVLLRLIGAARRQVARMVVIEAALLGAISQAIGLVVGLGLAVILIYVINVQSFGWTIQFSVPVLFLIQATIAVIVATALSGLFPARHATQIVFAREE